MLDGWASILNRIWLSWVLDLLLILDKDIPPGIHPIITLGLLVKNIIIGTQCSILIPIN